MNFRSLHELAVAASLAYIPWDEASAASGAAMAAQAYGQRALSSRWASHFLQAAGGLGWQIPVAGIKPNDAAGFAANLFETAAGKLLAIRGTEVVPGSWGLLASLLPGADFGEEMRKDVLDADLDILCSSGFAAQQTLSLVNYIERLITPLGAVAPQWQFAPAENLDLRQIAAALHDGLPPAQILWQPVRDLVDATGMGLIAAGEQLQVVGHSLGGQLAAFALRLFPDVFTDAVLFNAPAVGNVWAERFVDALKSRPELGTIAAEEAQLGFSHVDVGALLMQRWNMPAPIEAAAFYHHDLELAQMLAAEHAQLVGCVVLANELAHRLGHGGPAHEGEGPSLAAALELFSLDEPTLAEVQVEVEEAVAAERTGM